MKSLKQIKKELNDYIDSISDEKELMSIYENTLGYLKDNSEKDKADVNDNIVNYQQKKSDETVGDGSSDENKKDRELKKSIERWFNDGGKNAC